MKLAWATARRTIRAASHACRGRHAPRRLPPNAGADNIRPRIRADCRGGPMWLPGGVRSGTPGVPLRRGGSQTRPWTRALRRGRCPYRLGIPIRGARRLGAPFVGAAFGRPGVWGHSPHGGHRGRIFYPGQAAGPESPAAPGGHRGRSPLYNELGGGRV